MADDIRTDGRAVALKRASARGQVNRNSGDFTRGSQLLSHGILMWLSGAKKPIPERRRTGAFSLAKRRAA